MAEIIGGNMRKYFLFLLCAITLLFGCESEEEKKVDSINKELKGLEVELTKPTITVGSKKTINTSAVKEEQNRLKVLQEERARKDLEEGK